MSNASLAVFQKRRRFVLAGLLAAVSPVLLVVRSGLGGDAHEAVETLGMLLIGTSIVGRLWCALYIGGRKSATVVDRGPYSLTRNPLYVFSILAAAGIGAQSGSLTMSALFCLLAYAVLRVTISREEAHLSDRFGPAYADYRRRVPRLLPSLAGFRDARRLEVEPKFFYRTFRDSSAFLCAVPVFELIEHAQDVHALPVLFRLL